MYLYKYLCPSRLEPLTTHALRFTQAQGFNDPFEVFPNIEAMIPPEKLHEYLAQFEGTASDDWHKAIANELATRGLPPGLADLLTYDVARKMGFDVVALMERLLPSMVEQNREEFGAAIQRKVGDRIGILSLSENPTSLLMWAHYASSHEGFLLEFDSSHSFFNQPKKNEGEVFGSLFPVTYSAERPAVTMHDPTADATIWAQRLIAQVFLTKSTDWSYEKEWRMFLPLDDQTGRPHRVVGGRIHLFDFPPDALTGVVLGARASEQTIAKVQGIVATNPSLQHVRVLSATVSVRRFEVIIGKAA